MLIKGIILLWDAAASKVGESPPVNLAEALANRRSIKELAGDDDFYPIRESNTQIINQRKIRNYSCSP